jgi:hypothetical protein
MKVSKEVLFRKTSSVDKNNLLKQKNKEFILCLLSTHMVRVAMNDGDNLWERLTPEWKNDRDIACEALVHNCVRVNDLPDSFQSDRRCSARTLTFLDTSGASRPIILSTISLRDSRSFDESMKRG